MLGLLFLSDSKARENMEQNKNESQQQTGIIILGLFLIGFQGIFNTWIQSLLVLQCPPAAQRPYNETGGSRGTQKTQHFVVILSFFVGKAEIVTR